MSRQQPYAAAQPRRVNAASLGALQPDGVALAASELGDPEGIGGLRGARPLQTDLALSRKEPLQTDLALSRKEQLRNFHSFPGPPAEGRSMDEGVGSLAKSEPSVGSFAEAPATELATVEEKDDEELRRFAALPPRVRRAVLQYPTFIAAAFHGYAVSGDGEAALQELMRRTPEMLAAVDNAEFAESPIGQAMLKQQAKVGDFFIRLAHEAKVPQVLGHRNSSGHTLAMLAMELGEKHPELLRRLLAERPGQVHECYDCDGRNALHHCAMDGGPRALRAVLVAVGDRRQELAAALQMPDNDCLSPLHRMAQADTGAEMLQLVADRVDLRRRCQHACGLSLLAAAAGAGQAAVCRWLLDVVKVEVDEAARQLAARWPAVAEVLLHASLDSGVASVDTDAGFCEEDESEPTSEDEEAMEDAEMAAQQLEELKLEPQPEPSSDCLSQLSEKLRRRGCSERFVQALLHAVPELRPNEEFLQLAEDQVYVAITLLLNHSARPPQTLVQILGQVLRNVEQGDLCSLLPM